MGGPLALGPLGDRRPAQTVPDNKKKDQQMFFTIIYLFRFVFLFVQLFIVFALVNKWLLSKYPEIITQYNNTK